MTPGQACPCQRSSDISQKLQTIVNIKVVLVVKNLPANTRDRRGLGLISGEGNGNPIQHSRLENPHGQKSPAIYSPWGCRESDGTEATWHIL